MLVVKQMHQPPPLDRLEPRLRREIRFPLELHRAHHPPRPPGLDPPLHQPQKPLRIRDHVAHQPIHRPHLQPERALLQRRHPRHRRHRRVQRRLVHRRHRRPQLRQHPRPPARRRPQIQADIPRPRPGPDPRQRLPQLQISPARRPHPVLLEPALPIRERARLRRAVQQPTRRQQRPSPQMRRRRRLRKPQRPRLDRRQPLPDQRHPPMLLDRIRRPIPLHRPQRIRPGLHGRAGDLDRRRPHLERPSRSHRRRRRQRQPPMPSLDRHPLVPQLLRQDLLEPLGRQISAPDHRSSAESPNAAQPSISATPPTGAVIPKLGPPRIGE